MVPIEHLPMPSISKERKVMWVEDIPLWMGPIIAILQYHLLPSDKGEARKLRKRAINFIFQDGILYK